MEEEGVVLLEFWSSPYVMRVKIALEEKGIQFLYKEEENIFLGKSPLLLEANPIYKKVPVLIHNGKPICESHNILEYIDQVWKDKFPILPHHPYERARSRFWIDFFDKMIYDIGRRMWASKGEDQEDAKQEFLKSLKLLEEELGDKPYFGGGQFGLLDIALIPFSCRFYTYETFCKFNLEKICPNLMKWVNKCNERESVSKALPNPYKVYDFVLEVKKMLGIE
ncbi:probable glutathione S-transferase parA isoform X1 [Olea europaea var. sylvestris]|uniref:probable glutathione S-transferase parA isoform X1 n=1 Tax=Olea europaea var. sylvestris TaxID=158386 RepID=UPI000C1D5AFC|nr:probable glutathione S-transferase parA isoform X1 [Olea europaea var. sylvestris]